MINKNAIMSVVNQTYIDPLKVYLASLFTSNRDVISYYLFHEDLTEDDEKNISEFVSQYDNADFHFMKVTSETLDGLPVTKKFPKEIYFKLLGLDLLPKELDKVLCMDLDMVVKGNIMDVFSLDADSFGIAACPDVFGHYFGLMENNLDCLSLSHDRPYFNAGFMLFSLNLIRSIGGGKAIINLAHLHKDKLYYPEQDILNVIFHDSFVSLPWEKYNCPPLLFVLDPKEVQKGNLLPLPFSRVMVDDIPEGYLDYTECVYERASVIHYMSESKPWKTNRNNMEEYEIFDRAYNEVTNSILYPASPKARSFR